MLEQHKKRLIEAVEYQNAGRTKDAQKICLELRDLYPRDFGIAHLLGLTFYQLGDFAKSWKLLKQAADLNPNSAVTQFQLGNALLKLNQNSAALDAYDRAIALKPGFARAYNGRGNALKALNKNGKALASYDKALSLAPELAEAHNSRGNVLLDLKRPQEALECYDRAIEVNPDSAFSHHGRGCALRELRRLEDALASFDRAIALRPEFADACYNRGNVLKLLGRFDESFESFEKARTLKPGHRLATWNQANLLLLLGKIERGLRQYEFRSSRTFALKDGRFSRPQLSSDNDLAGKKLLIWHELHLGDLIQFCRYARLAEERGAAVTIAAPEKMHELIATLSPAISIAPETISDEGFDYHLPLMSGPLAFRSDLNGFPSTVPYLKADPWRVERWKDRIGTHGLKVGICWQGSKLSEQSGRSFPLAEFHALSKMKGVRLISLQKFDGLEQLASLPEDMQVETLGDAFDAGPQAFVDTAAVLECLDLVITCDTSVAHLAGALARPTWILLKTNPDWRWFLERADSPWYPTARLFRQTVRNEWRSVFDEVRAAVQSSYGL